jgi:asparagine synthase (glutamine-hydrolysing)
MCGITGCYDLARQASNDELTAAAAAMSETLTHRGPDDSGVWTHAQTGVGLGHRRLSIIDLSAAGRQPMVSPCGRFVLVFNGEIYNFRELRGLLEKQEYPFRGRSDTEVLLAAIVVWGVRGAVARLNGMFAFAVWDAEERTLTLARDPVGIKPLYYGWFGSTLLFGSELKSLRRHPAFRGEIDRDALALFFEYGYIPSPCSIYRHVRKLSPGCLLTVSPQTGAGAKPAAYWSIAEAIAEGKRNPFRGTPEESAEAVGATLSDAVRRQMVADVPVGVFLSGGIDSSLVTAVAQAETGRPVQAFTIGFEEAAYDESPFARKIASHLKVDHHVQVATSAEAQAVIPLLPAIYDEPFADSSQVPTFLVSRLAREHVAVCLSGDGGDELFAGYDRYASVARIRRKIGWLPQPYRRHAGRIYERASRAVGRQTTPGWVSRVTAASSDFALYHELQLVQWREGEGVVIGSCAARAGFRPQELWPDLGASTRAFVESMSAYDAAVYLPDDILTKVDRASMAVSLEVRVPLLDQRLVELAWRLPMTRKRAGAEGKLPLRALLARRVPPSLFDRPKMGFGVPIGQWLRGALRPWAEELLHPGRLAADGWLNPQPIREKWKEHVAGTRDWQAISSGTC